MTIDNIPFEYLPMLAKTDRAYSAQDPLLRPFYKYDVSLEAFEAVMADKKQADIPRQLLVETLKKQYASMATPQYVADNIAQLAQDNCFTVTTAHQPALFTGPLYFIYKIFSTIRLAENLKAAYPSCHFVPVFVIGGEDHDFEEVNFIHLFNKKIVWQNEGAQGAVGMMTTESLRPVLDELQRILGDSETAQTVFQHIEAAYTQHTYYQDATQDLLNRLFGAYGLVVLNMNDAALKRAFIPIMAQEITEKPSKSRVEATQKALNDLGFKAQAFPRDINLFYLLPNSRARIVAENGGFEVVNTTKKWASEAEILAELTEFPERFSPNVVLRPLYQEFILPNLAYIGGGGELAYWLERKSQFDYFKINFPMLIRRNSALWLDPNSQDRLKKLDLNLLDLTQNIDEFLKVYVAQKAEAPLSIETEKAAIEAIFDTILAKACRVEATLEKAVLGEKTKQMQAIEALQAKILRAEKQKQDTTVSQIKNLAQKLFPDGGLQERTDNFLNIYTKYGTAFFEVLYENLDPLQPGLLVFKP